MNKYSRILGHPYQNNFLIVAFKETLSEHKESVRQSMSIAFGAAAFGFGSVGALMMAMKNDIDSSMLQLESRMNDKVSKLEAKMDKLETKMDNTNDKLDELKHLILSKK